MPIAKMKDGRVLEVPIEELEQFFVEHGEEIELQERVPLSTPDETDFPFVASSTESPSSSHRK